MTLVSGPLKVDSAGWVKYCRDLLEYFRKVSADLLAKVQAFRKASFCSWCLLISWAMRVALSWSLEACLSGVKLSVWDIIDTKEQVNQISTMRDLSSSIRRLK